MCACLGQVAIGICIHVRVSRSCRYWECTQMRASSSCCCWDLHSQTTGAQWSPGRPRRPPTLICSQSAVPVRARNGAVHVRDGAAVVIHRQRVDGAAVPIYSQGVVPCHVGACHVLSCHVVSCHVTSRPVTSRHVTSCHAESCHVMSRPVLSHCVVLRREKRPQHIDAATSLSHYANARRSH